MTLWRLVHARAVYGLVVHNGAVVEAALQGLTLARRPRRPPSPRVARRAYSSEARRGKPLNAVAPTSRGSRVLTRGRALSLWRRRAT